MAITHLIILADEMADQLVDLVLTVLPSSDQEWQLHNSTVITAIDK